MGGLVIMANKELGEVAFEIGGKEYTLRLETGAMAAVETELDMDFDAVLKSRRVGCFISVFRHALRAHHGEISKEEAAELLNSAGLARARAAIGSALVNSRPLQNEAPSKNG